MIQEQQEQQIHCSGVFKPSRSWWLRAGRVRASSGREEAGVVQVIRNFQHGRAIQGSLWGLDGEQDSGCIQPGQRRQSRSSRKNNSGMIRSGVETEPGDLWLDEMRRGSEQVQVRLSILDAFTSWNSSLSSSSSYLMKGRIRNHISLADPSEFQVDLTNFEREKQWISLPRQPAL